MLSISIVYSNASPLPKADEGYGAPRFGYGAPSYRPRRPRNNVAHTHHHYYHRGASKEYSRPSYKPSYKPSYQAPTYSDYGPPARRPHRYAPSYGKFCIAIVKL